MWSWRSAPLPGRSSCSTPCRDTARPRSRSAPRGRPPPTTLVASHFTPFTLTFEGLSSPAPQLGYTLSLIGAIGEAVEFDQNLTIPGTIEFTGITVDMTVDQDVPPGEHDFLPPFGVDFCATSASSAQPTTVMEIVDAGAVPAVPGSWGRLKTLYR